MHRSRWVGGLTTLALLGLSVTTALLARRLREVAAAFDSLRIQAGLPHQGAYLPTFTAATTVDGDSVVIGGSTPRQLVFVLTASCPYCRASLPLWKKLADSATRLRGTDLEVVAISLDSVATARGQAVTEGFRFPVAFFPSRKIRWLSRAGQVPQTMVLDRDGLVLYAHTGVVTAPVVDSVYQALAWERPNTTRVALSSTAVDSVRR